MIVVLASLALGGAAAFATDWQAGTGNWSTGSNWTNGEPGSAEWAYIDNSGTAQITQSGEQCLGLTLGDGSSQGGTIQMSAGSLWAEWHERIGYSGTGTFSQTGGTNTASHDLYLGYNSGSSGTYNQAGGITTASYSLNLGFRSGSSGTYELKGTGVLSAQRECVGYSGTGTFTQTGGTNTASSDLNLGFRSGSSGTYELKGTGVLSAQRECVGYSGTGTFTQTGGTNTASHDLRLGASSGSSGTYSQTGGTNTASYALDLGSSSGSSGTYHLSGTGQLSAGFERIGSSGTGTFTQEGGTNAVSSELYLGSSSGSSGTYHLSGTGQLSAGFERIGSSGTGTFTQEGGTNTVSSELYVGYNSGSSGTYDLSGTGQLSAGSERIGYSGTGTFTQAGGTNTVSSDLSLGCYSGSSGTYAISGGQLSAGSAYVGNDTWGGEGAFRAIGNDAMVDFDSYYQSGSGELHSIFDSNGLSVIDVLGIAELAGNWYVEDPGANVPLGTFNVLTAGGGILGSFANVYLPDADWSWGIDGGTLWVEHVPEPATLSLLVLGGVALLHRRR